MEDYTLIGGITIQQIIGCIPMFDAMTKEFWVYANEYLPGDILSDDVYNSKIVNSIRSNFWFKEFDQITDRVSNDLSISYKIIDDKLQSLSISNCAGKQLFGRNYDVHLNRHMVLSHSEHLN